MSCSTTVRHIRHEISRNRLEKERLGFEGRPVGNGHGESNCHMTDDVT